LRRPAFLKASRKACLSLEVIFFRVIEADERDPYRCVNIWVVNALDRRIVQCSLGRIPPFNVVLEASLLLLVEPCYSGFNSNFLPPFAFGADVTAEKEVVLVDLRMPIEPVRPQNEIECLEHRRFADIVIANKDDVIGKEELSVPYPPEVLYEQPRDLHDYDS